MYQTHKQILHRMSARKNKCRTLKKQKGKRLTNSSKHTHARTFARVHTQINIKMDWLLKPLQFISPFHLIMQNINIINGFVTWTVAQAFRMASVFVSLSLRLDRVSSLYADKNNNEGNVFAFANTQPKYPYSNTHTRI